MSRFFIIPDPDYSASINLLSNGFIEQQTVDTKSDKANAIFVDAVKEHFFRVNQEAAETTAGIVSNWYGAGSIQNLTDFNQIWNAQ